MDNNIILEKIAEVEANVYHGALYRDAKKVWAIAGTYVAIFIYFSNFY
jgi:hypothetical protein